MQQIMEAVQTNGSNGMSVTHGIVQQGQQVVQNTQELIAKRVQNIKDIIKVCTEYYEREKTFKRLSQRTHVVGSHNDLLKN